MPTNQRKEAALVQLRPRPTRCRTRITDPDQAAVLRRLDCRLYDRCLTHAADRYWRGFHCNDCKAYQPPTPTERHRDHLAVMHMLEETQLLPSLLEPESTTDEEDDDLDELQPGFAPDPDDLEPGAEIE